MEQKSENIAVLRLAATGAISFFVFFAICWIAVFLALPAVPHAYLGLFAAAADPSSGTALLQGLSWSAVFGFLAGGLWALVHNLLGKIGRT